MLPEKYFSLDARAGARLDIPIVFTSAELQSMTQDEADEIMAHFNGQAMMRLPDWEIAFFEWMKVSDLPTWEDLWAGEIEPYIVSISFLPAFLENGHGFPVCDLVVHDNFYFHRDFVIKPEGTDLVGIIVEKVSRQERITANEAFLLEIMQHPIDVWHFAYKYALPVQDTKLMVLQYVDDEVLLHLKTSDELGDYVEL